VALLSIIYVVVRSTDLPIPIPPGHGPARELVPFTALSGQEVGLDLFGHVDVDLDRWTSFEAFQLA
jgi:hypothetical protein